MAIVKKANKYKKGDNKKILLLFRLPTPLFKLPTLFFKLLIIINQLTTFPNKKIKTPFSIGKKFKNNKLL